MAAVGVTDSPSAVLDRPWPPGRAPLDLPVPSLRPVAELPRIATKLCPLRHPNNPDRSTCAICRSSFDGAAEVVEMAPRPVARLLLEDGTGIEMAGPMVIGRCPEDRLSRSTEHSGDTLTVSGRQVSRRHLVLEVQGWQLLVRDAKSTNGTFLARRGERGRRRVPSDRAVAVEVGDAIHFGGRQVLVVHAG